MLGVCCVGVCCVGVCCVGGCGGRVCCVWCAWVLCKGVCVDDEAARVLGEVTCGACEWHGKSGTASDRIVFWGGRGVEARTEVLVNVDGGCMCVCVSLCDGEGVCMRACLEFRVFALLSALWGFGGAATAASKRGDTLLCTIHADIWKYRHWSCSCCSVLQCVAVCCSLLQCVAVCCSVLQRDAV